MYKKIRSWFRKRRKDKIFNEGVPYGMRVEVWLDNNDMSEAINDFIKKKGFTVTKSYYSQSDEFKVDVEESFVAGDKKTFANKLDLTR